MRPARVVAADALLGGAADVERFVVEVGVRAGRGIHDRPAPVDQLELVVAPVGLFRALVLAVADRDGLLREGLFGILGVEDELDHLPVALVQVVPVVEDVEDPVLERELAGVRGIGRDVRVHRRRASLAQPSVPALVVATRIERIPGEVEVVLEEVGQVVRRWADLDEVDRVPRPAQRDRRVSEEQVEVDRPVGLAVAALLLLLDDPDDGGVLRGQVGLVGEVGGGSGADDERREHREHGCERDTPAHAYGLDAKRSSPSSRDRNLAASCPLTLFPASSSRGENVPRPPFPGETVTMPPPMPLLPGSPTS